MKKMQKGFTLIELMIVVAVIGVLSAIALPQYQKYVAKAEATSALATVAALKTNIETSIADNAVFPTLVATAAGDVDLGVPIVTSGTIAFTPTGTASAGDVIYQFVAGASSSLLEVGTLTLTRTDDGDWSCKVKFGAKTDKGLLPNNCIY